MDMVDAMDIDDLVSSNQRACVFCVDGIVLVVNVGVK